MMQEIMLSHPADFDGWRAAARQALTDGIAPEALAWRVGEGAPTLFAQARTEAPSRAAPTPRVPRGFMELARSVICHVDEERFALLYRLLWRLAREPKLMQIASDPDVHRLAMMGKAVRRDLHKMKAFVRFREVAAGEGGPPMFIAWFEPAHHIVEAVAPFFARRFATMEWSILTPRRSVHWDGAALTFARGAARADVPTTDRLESYWQTYFASIFNPARVKLQAMTSEMPRKYWHLMPETALIPGLVRDAERRCAEMRQAGVPAPLPTGRAVDEGSIEMNREERDDTTYSSLKEARQAAENCQACPLWKPATQTVFGEGPARAPLMMVGEQPGDREDLEGRPFVGPAGRVLDQALERAGITRKQVFVTNAVKHFKFEPRGKRRLHKSPNAGEIEACRWWLHWERKLVRPKLIMALGASAARSLLAGDVRIGQARGKRLTLEDGAALMVTVHPSYLLRLRDEAQKEHELERFIADLAAARDWLDELSEAA